MNRNQEGITFVTKAYDYAGNELDRMEYVAEDETDVFEHEQEVCDFHLNTLTDYLERDI